MKKIMLFLGLFAALSLLMMGANAQATTLTAKIAADDAFEFYISTDNAVAGTLVGSDDWWYQPANIFNVELTAGTTYYLHIKAWDLYGGPRALLAEFLLSDSNYQFTNGTQALLSGLTDWTVYTDGFAGIQGTLASLGANSNHGTYGTFTEISSDALWIWLDDAAGVAYFTVRIDVAQPANQVPEPLSCVMLGLGLVGLAGLRRKIS